MNPPPPGVPDVQARRGAPVGALVSDTTPLYVDLDGTLIRTDLLWESLLSSARTHPVAALRGLARLRHGKAAMKCALAQAAAIDVATLPYNVPFLDWLRGEARRGRPIYLATAADSGLAGRVAAHLGFFSGVLASDGRHNLKGPNKLAAIREHRRGGPFAYCGNGPEDVAIFAAASEAIVVGASRSVEAAARASANVTHRFPCDPAGVRTWARAMRVHQWLKNLLVFVPLLTSFGLADPAAIVAAVVAFIAFCLVASGGYFVNDLLDLGADRQHPTKRGRPLASGRLSVPSGAAAAAAAFGVGFAAAAFLSWSFAGWLGAYAVLTLTYSMAIKRYAIFDLIALAALYTLRILAGGAAIGVEVSFWLLAFSVFLFFSLATVKRCGELASIRSRSEQSARGRGYHAGDLEVLKSFGTATSVAAVLVLALYVQTPEVNQRYAAPRALWLMLAALLTWLAHLWLVTWRGAMHDDPLVFALRDPTSRWLIAAMGVAFGCAALLRFG